MMRFLLPPPLVPTGDVVAIHTYKMNDTDWLGPYTESNVMFGAELPGKARGAYSTNLLLKSDVGVAHGRETHGQPKKYAHPKLEFRGDLIVAGLLLNSAYFNRMARIRRKLLGATPLARFPGT